jgi:DNA-binding XRE family transcriptional regulator
MTSFHSWDDVKREVFDAEHRDAITAGAQRMVAEARAHRLAGMRRQLGLAQREMAARMHVRRERVSAIERGTAVATEVGTIAAYVAALGGSLEIVVANFNGMRMVVA